MTAGRDSERNAMDWLSRIFTPEKLDRLRQVREKSDWLQYRLDVFSASGPLPMRRRLAELVSKLRAQRAAWDTYLCAAFESGLLDGRAGKELEQRITSPDDECFRGAMAECLACWIIRTKFKTNVRRQEAGADFLIGDNLQLRAEVKAPWNLGPSISELGFVAADHLALRKALQDANHQFSKGTQNVLVLVPALRLFQSLRFELVQAFIAEEKVVIPLWLGPKKPAPGPPRSVLVPDASFTKKWPDHRYTRVGAVMCILERSVEARFGSAAPRIDHDVLVLHNPHALRPVPHEIFSRVPQFVETDDGLVWTDGAALGGRP